MNSAFPRFTHRSNPRQSGQGIVEFVFVLAAVAVIVLVMLHITGASNTDLVGRVTCTIQARQWVDISATAGQIPSPIYGCLKAGVTDPMAHSSSYLGSRSSYLPGLIFDTRTHKRVG